MSSTARIKRFVLPNLPYLIFLFAFANIGEGFRLSPGADISDKFLNLDIGFTQAFESLWAGAMADWLVGILGAAAMKGMVYLKGKNAKKYRKDIEYGSARWSA